MTLPSDYLYSLLPAIYRSKDEAMEQNPGALRALMEVLQKEWDTTYRMTEQLYENWFIESCEDWCIPYIADALGITLDETHPFATFQRARVANSVGFKEGAGTLAALEHACKNTTGWSVKVVECFRYLASTQNVANPDFSRTLIALSDKEKLLHCEDMLRTVMRGVEVRKEGRYHPHTLGMLTWRMQVFPVVYAEAGELGSKYYSVHPLGVGMPLYHFPKSNPYINASYALSQLPLPLDPFRMKESYGPYGSFYIVQVFEDGSEVPVAFEQIEIVEDVLRERSVSKLSLDIKRGRIALPIIGAAPKRLMVRYHYAASGPLGAGPYSRKLPSLALHRATLPVWRAVVGGAPFDTEDMLMDWYQSLEEALEAWRKVGGSGVIRIAEGYRVENVLNLHIMIHAGECLVIEAMEGTMPVWLFQELYVRATGHGASFIASGLMIGGTLHVQGELSVTLVECTLRALPGDPSIKTQEDEATIAIERSIVGKISMASHKAHLIVKESVVDGGKEDAILAGALTIDDSTVFGPVHVREMRHASNTLFDGHVQVTECFNGRISYSYVPRGSRIPIHTACQPMKAVEHVLATDTLSFYERKRAIKTLTARIQPLFLSKEYGQPGYAALASYAPEEIREGAADGGEMGVFHALKTPLKEKNYHYALKEYLPVTFKGVLLYEDDNT